MRDCFCHSIGISTRISAFLIISLFTQVISFPSTIHISESIFSTCLKSILVLSSSRTIILHQSFFSFSIISRGFS